MLNVNRKMCFNIYYIRFIHILFEMSKTNIFEIEQSAFNEN